MWTVIPRGSLLLYTRHAIPASFSPLFLEGNVGSRRDYTGDF